MQKLTHISVVCAVACFFALNVLPLSAQEKGAFQGRLVSEWMEDDRRMKLLETFEYTDAKKRRWIVPAGTVVDGASIPQPFWSVIGAPFSGAYRKASVIHDYYCDTRSRSHEDVHRAFYEAMRDSGVSAARAWLMYKAVERFGPRWTAPKLDPRCEPENPDYDFERCAVASKPPALVQPPLNRAELLKFARELAGTADAQDLKALEAAGSAMD